MPIDAATLAANVARATLCNRLTGDDWLAIQNAVSNDGDLDQLKRMELVEALGELAALAPIPATAGDDDDDDDEMDCGQCEGTGTTDAMGYAEECPVCDGTGRIPVE
jgi:hypothetical protein